MAIQKCFLLSGVSVSEIQEVIGQGFYGSVTKVSSNSSPRGVAIPTTVLDTPLWGK